MKYEIEGDVPIPKLGRPRDPNSFAQALRNLAKAPLGSSVYLPNSRMNTVYGRVVRAKDDTGAKFSCRAIDGGVRVWRVG